MCCSIKVGYELVDPQVIAARKRLEQMKKGQALGQPPAQAASEGATTGAPVGVGAGAAKGREGKPGAPAGPVLPGGVTNRTMGAGGALGGGGTRVGAQSRRSLASMSTSFQTNVEKRAHVHEKIEPLPPPLVCSLPLPLSTPYYSRCNIILNQLHFSYSSPSCFL